MPARIDDGLTNTERYRLRHPDRHKAAQAKYRASAKGKAMSARKTRKRNGVVGATGERPSGHCAICSRYCDVLCLDHDHATGRIRGWLCRTCNAGIGQLGDTLEALQRAVRYLEGS